MSEQTYDYEYIRELINNAWDIDNPERVDGEGNQIFVSSEIIVAIPTKSFKGYYDGSVALFCFDEELTSAEKTTLDTVIYNHKNNL